MKVKHKTCFCLWALLSERSYKIRIFDCWSQLNILSCLEKCARRSSTFTWPYPDRPFLGWCYRWHPQASQPWSKQIGCENYRRNRKYNL